MNNFKKTAAVMLSASLLLGMCGCSSKIDQEVIERADQLASAITKRDYSKIEALASEDDEALEEILTLPSSSDDDLAAKELIASTLTYEVDSDSYEGKMKGGSVDVIFTYVDYEPVTSDVLFLDIEELEATISSCTSTVEVTLTFDFSKTKEGIVCTNISEAEALFPYASIEFEYALPYSEYAGAITIEGAEYSAGEYIFTSAPSSISGNLEITGDGCDILWDYYWIIEDEHGGYIDGGPTQTEICPSNLYFDSPYTDRIYPNGTYSISFYSTDYRLIATQGFTIDVEAEPSSSAPSSSSSSGAGVYFDDSEDGVIEFPYCDLAAVLPDGATCLTPEEIVSVYGDQGVDLNFLVFLAEDGETLVYANALNAGAYDSYSALTDLFDAEEAQINWLDMGGADYDSDYPTYTVGDREFEAVCITILTGDEEWYNTFILVGDESTSFLVTCYSKDPDYADRLMQGFYVP